MNPITKFNHTLKAMVKASKEFQSVFYSFHIFSEKVSQDPYKDFVGKGNYILCDFPVDMPGVPLRKYAIVDAADVEVIEIYYTRHKQRTRHSKTEVVAIQGTEVRMKKIQEAGWTYTFYFIPKSVIAYGHQKKDTFDIVFDMVKLNEWVSKEADSVFDR